MRRGRCDAVRAGNSVPAQVGNQHPEGKGLAQQQWRLAGTVHLPTLSCGLFLPKGLETNHLTHSAPFPGLLEGIISVGTKGGHFSVAAPPPPPTGCRDAAATAGGHVVGSGASSPAHPQSGGLPGAPSEAAPAPSPGPRLTLWGTTRHTDTGSGERTGLPCPHGTGTRVPSAAASVASSSFSASSTPPRNRSSVPQPQNLPWPWPQGPS